MKLSIIIVNYNVEYFLEQCLHSVQIACKNIDTEIFVVDNNSVDASVKMLHDKFPFVKLIENKDNRGFSKANNQAIVQSEGEYVLLLNPDTVVESDTFEKVIQYMDQNPETGGLGVKMIDGKGNFLAESKRGLPTPEVAFYKIFGLSKLFPQSKKFGKYHLSYLDNNQIHEVEILAGAFMMMRKSVLDEIGLLDEAFFMYGEDIDLSYRIIKAGYKNVYFPDTRIIHYKGESTKKSSVNYVFVFYNAMIIFAQKHFSQKNARLFSVLINTAIYLRATLSIVKRFFSKLFLPVLDFLILWGGIYLLKNYWSHYFLSIDYEYYPIEYILLVVPAYILIWLLSFLFAGGYEKPHKLSKVFQGIAIGTIIILVIYALLNASFRFSRAMILLGAIWSVVSMIIIRLFLHLTKIKTFRLGENINKRFIIAGDAEEAERVADLLRKTNINPGFIGLVNTSDQSNNKNFIGNLSQIKDIIEIYKIDEVIFCAKSLSAAAIISKMSELKNKAIDYKIAPPESLFLIGSNSINTSGDLYIIDINAINKPNNQRNKRLLDIAFALFLLALSPILILFQKHPLGFIANIFSVMFAQKTWVGYFISEPGDIKNLPAIKKSVLTPCDVLPNKTLGKDTVEKLNLLYSRDYKTMNDVSIVLKNIRNLGR
ncbi:MAG: glycosyltransferase [Bacteroidetes bacterium]|nr:glycosyltransferase [Bacteroidota bacterium]